MNASARKQRRDQLKEKPVAREVSQSRSAGCAIEGEKERKLLSDNGEVLPKVSVVPDYPFDSEAVVQALERSCHLKPLVDAIAHRYEYTKALNNFAYFHDRDVHGIEPDEIVKSSAGVHGWAEAELDTSTDPLGSGMELPPTADEHRHGERNNVKNTKDPPESKP